MGLIYLASPYSYVPCAGVPEIDLSAPDAAERVAALKEERFQATCHAAAYIMAAGFHVFSPVAHCHPIALAGGLPSDWTFWAAYCRTMVAACSEIWVLRLPGWEESAGIRAEMSMAADLRIPVSHLGDPRHG